MTEEREKLLKNLRRIGSQCGLSKYERELLTTLSEEELEDYYKKVKKQGG